jgi:hypothetical protein
VESSLEYGCKPPDVVANAFRYKNSDPVSFPSSISHCGLAADIDSMHDRRFVLQFSSLAALREFYSKDGFDETSANRGSRVACESIPGSGATPNWNTIRPGQFRYKTLNEFANRSVPAYLGFVVGRSH